MRISSVNFIRESSSKSINNGVVYNRIGFKCICATFSRQYTALLQTFYQSNWISKVNVRLQCQRIPNHQCTKMLPREIYVFWQEAFKVVKISLSGTWSLPFHYGFCWSHEHSHSRKTQSHAKTVSQLKCLEERQKVRFTVEMKDLVMHSLVRIWGTFSEVLLVMNLEYCWEEKDLTHQNLPWTLSAYTLSWNTRTWLSTISLATRRLHCCAAFILFPSSRLETL